MSTKKETKKETNLPNEVANAGRDLWLAGLGAMATVEKEGTTLIKDLTKQGDRFVENLQTEANRIFRSFVDRGEKVETKGRRRLNAVAEDVEARQDKVTGTIEDLVGTTVEKALGAIDMPTRTEVKALTTKVEKLTAQVDALAAALTDAPMAAKAEATPEVERTLYSVVPEEDGWAVIKSGNERATSLHDTKVDAVDAARELARNQEPSRLIILKKDGSVQDTNLYG